MSSTDTPNHEPFDDDTNGQQQPDQRQRQRDHEAHAAASRSTSHDPFEYASPSSATSPPPVEASAASSSSPAKDDDDDTPTDESPTSKVVAVSGSEEEEKEKENSQKEGEGEEEETPQLKAWRSCQTRQIVFSIILHVLCAFTFGLTLGFIPIFLTLSGINSDCPEFSSEAACTNLRYSGCVWNASAGGCLFDDYKTVNCSQFSGSSDACGTESVCAYDYDDDVCFHSSGYSAFQSGLFVGSMFIGGVIGPPFIAESMAHFGFRWTTRLYGLVGLLAASLASISVAYNLYPLLIVARIIHGAIGYGGCSLGPVYSGHEMGEASQYVTPTFQAVVMSAVVSVAVYGISVEPRDFSTETNMHVRIHCLFLFLYISAAAMFILSFFLKESSLWKARKRAEKEEKRFSQAEKALDAEANAPDASPRQPQTPEGSPESPGSPRIDLNRLAISPEASKRCGYVPYLLLGLFVAFALNGSGIGPIAGFAPVLMTNAGLRPLLGNLVFTVVGWAGAICTYFVPKIHRNFRHIFLTGILFAATGSFIAAWGAHPVIEEETTKIILTLVGLAVFVLAFNMLLAPYYIVWSLMVYPPEFRGFGSAFCNTVTATVGLILSWLYPILVIAFSGGPAGNQGKGQAIMFWIFSAIELINLTVLAWKMHEYLMPTTPMTEAEEKELVEAQDEPQVLQKEHALVTKQMQTALVVNNGSFSRNPSDAP